LFLKGTATAAATIITAAAIAHSFCSSLCSFIIFRGRVSIHECCPTTAMRASPVYVVVFVVEGISLSLRIEGLGSFSIFQKQTQ
jgi:hypothetical protein